MDMNMDIPVEVLRATNSNDSVGIGQKGEDADPVSVSRFIFLSSWREGAYSFEFSYCARTAMVECKEVTGSRSVVIV